jgi:hypothetical protein
MNALDFFGLKVQPAIERLVSAESKEEYIRTSALFAEFCEKGKAIARSEMTVSQMKAAWKALVAEYKVRF